VDGCGAAADSRGAASAGAARAGPRRHRRRRGAGAPDGRLPVRRPPEGHPGRVVHVGRPRSAGVSGRRFFARSGGGPPQHFRRVGARDEDERGPIPSGVHLPALSVPEGSDRRRVLQREGARPLLPRPSGDPGRRRSTALRTPRRRARAVRAGALLRAVQGGRREPQYAPNPPGARRGRRAARLGPRGSPRLRGSAPEPR
jgi:hypothetical protein